MTSRRVQARLDRAAEAAVGARDAEADGQHQHREREHDVHRAGEHRVDDPAVVAGDQADVTPMTTMNAVAMNATSSETREP